MTEKSLCCDLIAAGCGLLAFALPITLLFPDFSLWTVLPKVHVARYHVISQTLSWEMFNAVLISLFLVFFCLFLEMRKRKLDDMVESVLFNRERIDDITDVEEDCQAAAMIACAKLFDPSIEPYEDLLLLRDELHAGDKLRLQRPPSIQSSSIEAL